MRALRRPRAAITATLALLLAIAATLPALAAAQTPAAGDVTAQGCAAPGAVPVLAGESDREAVTIAETERGITLIMPDGTAHDLPAGELHFASGMVIVLAEDGTRTVLGATTGEIWTFAPVQYSDFQSGMSPATAPFVQTGPYIAGPVADDGLDWQIVDVRTGEAVMTSEILGGPLPVPADAFALPGGDAVAAIRFQQMAAPITDPAGTPAPPASAGATLVIPGELAGAAFIDLDPDAPIFHDVDPLLFAGDRSAVFGPDRAQVAWATGATDPFGDTHEIHVASLDALDQPTTYLTPGVPDARVPLLFTPDGSALLTLVDGALTRIDLATGEAQPADAPDLTAEGIRVDNPVDGTIIYDAGTSGQPDLALYDAASNTTTPLPELNAYQWLYPFAGWTYAGATSATDTVTTVLVDTRTGQIAAPPPADAAPTGAGATPLAGDFRDGVLVTGRSDNTVLVQNGATGEAWVMAMPEGMEPGLVPRLAISPSVGCLLVVTTAPGGNLPFGNWLAPLAPNAAWTVPETPVLGWWQLDAE